MTSSAVSPPPADFAGKSSEEVPVYRDMSRAALGSLVLGVLSLLGLIWPPLLSLAVGGLLAAWVGLRNLRRHPDELSGRLLAVWGSSLSVLVLVGGVAFHSYIYATEVPDGYMRISFATLQPDDLNARDPVPVAAKELDGKRVFVAGYIHPDAGMAPVQQFVLVPDMGTCCFGGQPKLTDMIEVSLSETQRVRYSTRKRKLAGVLTVDSELKPIDGLLGVYYQLKVDQIIR